MTTDTTVIDFLNWQTMVAELIIGGIVAAWFFLRQKRQSDNIEELTTKINERQGENTEVLDKLDEILSKQKIIIETQERFWKRREAYRINQLRSCAKISKRMILEEQLTLMKLYKKKTPIKKIRETWKKYQNSFNIMIYEFQQIGNVANDVIDPHILTSVDAIILNYNEISNEINNIQQTIARYEIIEQRIEHILSELPTDWVPSPGMDNTHIHTPERFF